MPTLPSPVHRYVANVREYHKNKRDKKPGWIEVEQELLKDTATLIPLLTPEDFEVAREEIRQFINDPIPGAGDA